MKSVLVVEDDRDILFAVTLLLEGEGYRVSGAENGIAALEFLKSGKMPDLILLDMLMPEMNGWQFAAAFAEKYGNSAPIITMTAAADANQRARDVGAFGWIGKPFDLDELLALLKKLEDAKSGAP